MSSWIGLPGALVELKCPSREDATPERAHTELVTLSGRRVVQLGRRVRRSWGVENGVAYPRDYAVLDALTRWETPLVWVGALAQATNLLTPEQAALDPSDVVASGGASILRGALDLGDLVVPQWATGHSGSTLGLTGGKPVPVRGGVPITISAYVQRADPATPVQMVFEFLDATGAVLFSTTRDSPAASGIVRASWGLTPPVGSASLSLRFRYAAVLAAPQVTWTPTVTKWSPGRGVHRVVALPGSESPIAANSRHALASNAYTILEVG